MHLNMIAPNRQELFEEMDSQIGNTPIVEYSGEVPNNNRIFIKRECDNPFGSHYDRVFLALFREYEKNRGLTPKRAVFETTSGSAGVSFAGIGRKLGYRCHVAIPEGGEKAREDAIRKQGAELHLTDEASYIAGFKKHAESIRKKTRSKWLNHSSGRKGKNNEITLFALEGIAREAFCQIEDNYQMANIHFFLPAVGNGSSVLGPGRFFHMLNGAAQGLLGECLESFHPYDKLEQILEDANNCYTNIVPWESFQAAVLFDLYKPGEYKRIFGIDPGTLARHRLPGTSYQGLDSPHIPSCIKERLIKEVFLVSDAEQDKGYYELTGRRDSERLIHWDDKNIHVGDMGRTTKGGVAVALYIAEEVSNRNFLVLGYDKAERYDSLQ